MAELVGGRAVPSEEQVGVLKPGFLNVLAGGQRVVRGRMHDQRYPYTLFDVNLLPQAKDAGRWKSVSSSESTLARGLWWKQAVGSKF